MKIKNLFKKSTPPPIPKELPKPVIDWAAEKIRLTLPEYQELLKKYENKL